MSHGPPAKSKNRIAAADDNNELEHDDELPIPPDGGWGWIVVLASFAIHIVTDGITYSFGIFILEFNKCFNEGSGYTSVIVSILVGVTLCSGPISSSFVNRYGCRTVTIVGSILASVCLVISVWATNVLMLIITIGIGAGFGFGLIYLPAIVSVTMYFEKYRSLATGIAVCGSGFGTVVFSPLTTYLINEYKWNGAMLIIAAIVLNCIFLGALFRPLEAPKKTNKIENIEENNKRMHEIEVKAEHEEVKRKLLQKPPNGHNNNLIVHHQSEHIRSHSFTDKNNGGNGGMNKANSQPLLGSPIIGDKPLKISRSESSGTMYRKDILYQGSLTNLPQYQSTAELSNKAKYGSLRRDVPHENENALLCGCCPCSKETKDTFHEMLDFSLLLNPIFIIFVISNFCTSIGFNIPYVYIAAQAEFLNLPKDYGSYLISVIGMANTIGRIVLGYLSDKSFVNRLYVYNTCLTLCGISTILSIFCLDFTSLAIYSVIFGFTIGAYVGLTSVILVDLLGLEKLTNAFGLLLLFQGFASFIGPPIGGALYDFTQSYEPAFILAGITITCSGLVLFAIPPIQRYLARKREHHSHIHFSVAGTDSGMIHISHT